LIIGDEFISHIVAVEEIFAKRVGQVYSARGSTEQLDFNAILGAFYNHSRQRNLHKKKNRHFSLYKSASLSAVATSPLCNEKLYPDGENSPTETNYASRKKPLKIQYSCLCQ